MEQDWFKWTIWDYGESASSAFNSTRYSLTIELYIFSVQIHNRNNVELYPNISSCNQTMRIEHLHTAPEYILIPKPSRSGSISFFNKKHKYFDERDYKHCLMSSCYFIYPYETNASWNSAQRLCQQDGMQLLTVNSDVKAQFIEDILHDYIYLYFPRDPLLFLNMKQDDKVYIDLRVRYNNVFSS